MIKTESFSSRMFRSYKCKFDADLSGLTGFEIIGRFIFNEESNLNLTIILN